MKNDFPEEFVIYIDNKFPYFFDQVKYFFESGFFTPAETILIAKFYPSNCIQIFEAAQKYGFNLIFYLRPGHIPNLDGRIIFYPYNAQSNCRLLLNRNARHIFLTHGESNKKASINKMARLYDYVLAAGELSKKRYLESKIFTPYDLAEGRVVCIGSSLTASCFEYLSESSSTPCVVYMPTWEGGIDEENFSSIGFGLTPQYLFSILNSLGIDRLLIKCHPNTGSRRPEYKQDIVRLAQSLMDYGIKVYVDPDSTRYFIHHPQVQSAINKDLHNLKVAYGVVDVSASEYMLAAKKIPTVVFLIKKSSFFAPHDYLSIRGDALIDLDDDRGLDTAIHYLKNFGETDAFINQAFSLEDHLKNKSPFEIGKILQSKWLSEVKIEETGRRRP
jgi:hypothetical protein